MKKTQKTSIKPQAMVKATYQDTAFNKVVSDIPAHTPKFKTYVEQTSAIMDELPGKFGATLAYHMDKLHLTNEALAGRSLINEDTIRKYRNGSNKSKPNIQTVVALCVGLQLPLPFSLDLVHKSGHTFAGEPSDIAYLMILSTMTGSSMGGWCSPSRTGWRSRDNRTGTHMARWLIWSWWAIFILTK